MDNYIRSAQKEVLNVFAKQKSSFALAGGTALELYYLKHRFSVDLDFFSPRYTNREVSLIVSRLKKNFKGIKLGSIPPFGGLWKLPAFVDKELLKNQKIIVNSGIYEQSFKIKTSDLKKTSEQLIIGSFSKSKK